MDLKHNIMCSIEKTPNILSWFQMTAEHNLEVLRIDCVNLPIVVAQLHNRQNNADGEEPFLSKCKSKFIWEFC